MYQVVLRASDNIIQISPKPLFNPIHLKALENLFLSGLHQSSCCTQSREVLHIADEQQPKAWRFYRPAGCSKSISF